VYVYTLKGCVELHLYLGQMHLSVVTILSNSLVELCTMLMDALADMLDLFCETRGEDRHGDCHSTNHHSVGSVEARR